jgi:hypothetical protein
MPKKNTNYSFFGLNFPGKYPEEMKQVSLRVVKSQ